MHVLIKATQRIRNTTLLRTSNTQSTMADKFDVFTQLVGGKDNLPPKLPTPPPPSDNNIHNPEEKTADIVDAFGSLQTYDDFVNSGPLSHIRGQAARPRHHVTSPSKENRSEADSGDFTLDPRKGEPAPAGTSFCPFLAIAKFPYKYVDSSFRQPIATAFFNEGKIYNRKWDLYVLTLVIVILILTSSSYYAWNDQTAKAITFIPLSQAQTLVEEVNTGFPKLKWQFDSRHEEEGLLLNFEDPNPEYRPRFLGCADNRSKFDFLVENIDPCDFSNMDALPQDRSKEAFRQMMALAADAAKNKNKKNKSARQERNILNRQSMSKQLLQAQRYLGLLPGEASDPLPEGAATGVKAVNVEEPACYLCESDVIIIAIDVEAYEKAHNIITEVGVSTLDTRDLKDTAPGTNGQNWQQFVRARHFRVQENKGFVNGEFVAGCPEHFEFGDSEWASLQDMPSELTRCFHEPFSKPGSPKSKAPVQEDPEHKRNIVLLGHDVEQDVQYCHRLGFSVLGRGNMLSIMDTRSMYQAHTRDHSPRGLGSIMVDFDFSAWHLHNAGNDAVYTMWAMIAISVQAAVERDTEDAKKKQEEREQSKLQKAVEAAQERVREESEGWDLSDDGGAPLRQPPSKSGHYTAGGAPLDI